MSDLVKEASPICKRHMAFELDPRAKIAILAFYSVCLFFADTWAAMAAFFIIDVVACIALKPSMKSMFKLGIIVYVICILTVIFNMFMISSTGLSISIEGLLRGLFFACRIFLLVMTSLILCLTTDALSISYAFSSFLAPLSHLKVPVDDVACILSITLRFIPLTAKEFFEIKDAQWSRCADFDEGPISSRIKSYCSILIPLFINMFRKADSLAMSMDARGYGISWVRRVDINERKLGKGSMLVACAVCAAIVAIAVLG